MTDNTNEPTVQEHARFLVALGRHAYDDVVQQCLEILDAPTNEDEQLARRLVADEFAAHLADQETWPDELDTDRLNRALRELDMAGIVARLDHTCCQSCGIDELGEEVPSGEDRRGYAFAHRQDMESAVPGGTLALSYGVFAHGEQSAEAQTEIGEEIAAALRRHGLDVDWNGSPRTRIEVSLDWKCRRYGDRAAWPGGSPKEVPGGLKVDFVDYRRGMQGNTTMSLPEARDVLLSLTPYKENFITFIKGSPSGPGLTATWESGPRLVFETPDPATRTIRGKQVTLVEAEELLTILADESRVAFDDDVPVIDSW